MIDKLAVHVEGRLGLVLVVRRRRDRPEVLLGVELTRIAHVIGGEEIPLDLEEVLRVAQMLQQPGRNVLLRPDRAGERAHPGPEHRVGLVPGVERDISVVRVNGGLHRVPNVVDLAGPLRGPV